MYTNQKLILIVDDSATMRMLTREALKSAGYVVLEVDCGEAALNLLKTTHPDAILLDVEMPGLNGFETCAEIRKIPEYLYTPIMIVTGLDDYESVNKAFLAGATDFTSKPINATLMGHRVRYIIRTSTHFQYLQAAEQKMRGLNTDLEGKVLEVEQAAQAAARFVPQDFLKMLNRESMSKIQLGDCVEKIMSVLFLDIRAFTTLSESSSSMDVFKLLNTLMSYLEPIIIKNHGFIDKYIGDAVMALFTSAEDAVQSGIEMLNALAEFNKERLQVKMEPVGIGIGINTGTLVLGTIGFEDRMDCTVISDAVNLSARLETSTRTFGVDLLITENTMAQIEQRDNFHSRSLGAVLVKGKNIPITIYEIYSSNSAVELQLKDEYAALFDEGIKHYHAKRFLEASSCFRQVLSKNPRDLPAEYFLQQCKL